MRLTNNTILITGGATGIGIALAEEFMKRDNTVLICGRRVEKLEEAKGKQPQLQTMLADVVNQDGRKALAIWAISRGANILINNAGMQREVDFTKGIEALEAGDNEVRTNFESVVYLTALLTPHLMKQENAAMMNVSSGLVFIPLAVMPVYCATKAAIHSFTISLRHQLASTGVKVFEIIPGVVDTELDRGARDKRGMTDRGIKPEQVAADVMEGMENDRFEIMSGNATGLVNGSKANFEAIFERMNQRKS